ncbi:MAG: NADH:ubiquinone reductase (Na(+)-transporting) subunit F [Rhodospirillales bacterium]|nr:NADH:ubiquinone reductase (Na(+)-transporting) subunit F [Rhodospirillales bacterium]
MAQVLISTAVFTGLIMVLAMIVLAARGLIWGRGQAQFIVNDEPAFASALGVKLTDALAGEGINLPMSCGGAGTCGLCRVRVIGSIDDALPTERALLGPREIKDGYRLACQVVVRGDMEISVPPELLGTETWTCTVTQTRTLSPLIKEIVLAFPSGEERDMPAGSFVLINTPPFELAFSDIEVAAEHENSWQRMGLRQLSAASSKPLSRAYSLVLRPDQPQMRLNIRLALPPATQPDAPPGSVSSYLFGLKTGDEVEVLGPYGHFFVQDSDAEMIFIGGGVGMAPLYTHIYDQLEKKATERRVSYWYGARTPADLYYADEMQALDEKHQNFSWQPVLSEPTPGDGWSGETGFVHDAVFKHHLQGHPDPAGCEYYLCGPPVMILAVRAMLDNLGVPRENIFSDDFGI